MTDLGSDFAGVDDLDANLSAVSGRKCLLQAVMRRWITSPGGLHYAPGYGGGIIDLASGIMPSPGAIAARLESQALEDERVESCDVDVSVVGEVVRIKGTIDDADGPFPFTIDMSATGAVVLSEVA